MHLNKKWLNWSNFQAIIMGLLLIQACASIQQPEGGPKDEEPPKLIKETPENYTRNFKDQKIILEFDEYFKLNNEFTEISISPTQEVPPVYRVKQKRLEIELKDTLETNTTYTINFGKAISDVNEGNKFKDYTYVFSTGNEIDSLQISGRVIRAMDNQPVLDASVFIIPISRDSIFGKKRASIFTVTDSSGNFKLKNLKENTYRLYALKEEGGGDRIFNNPKEEIAFLSDSVVLSKDTSNLLLKLFKEIPEQHRNIDRKIENDGKITIIYNRPIANPNFRIIEPVVNDAIIHYSKNADTTSIWIKNMEFDSLKVVSKTGDKILDTLTLRRTKRDTYNRQITFTSNLNNNKLKPGTVLTLTSNLPIENINKTKITLKQDSLLIPNFQIEGIDKSKRQYRIVYPWRNKKTYTLEFQNEALTDIYGTKNEAVKASFELDEIENYGNLSINVHKEDTVKQYIVQVIDEKENIIKENVVKNTIVLNYNMMPNGKYRIRVVEDLNANGVYDTGNVKRKEYPEKIWFYDKEIVIRPNWDREEKITIPKVFTDQPFIGTTEST